MKSLALREQQSRQSGARDADEPQEVAIQRTTLEQWFDLLADIKRTYPAEWMACERERASRQHGAFQAAWGATEAAYWRGDLRETADLITMAAIYEAQQGGRSSDPIELLVWAFLYRIGAEPIAP